MKLLHPDIPTDLSDVEDITPMPYADDKLRGFYIENISFAGARLKNVDLSEAHILSVKNVIGLKGATISYEQLTFLAPYFTQELGILIKE